jgi:TonB family protein
VTLLVKIFNKSFLFFILFAESGILYSQNGIINSYYPNKKIKESISYVNEILDGTSYYFYENGNLKSERYFSLGILSGVQRDFYENGLVKEEFYIVDGVREGANKIYYENGALKSIREYKRGILINSVDLDFDSTYNPPIEAYLGNRQNEIKKNIDLFICEIESCPKPAGGIEEIQNKIVYPKFAELYGLEGKVNVLTKVSESGEVLSVKVISGIGLGCDEEAERVIKETKFIPGFHNGKPVEADVIFNVEFRLKEKREVENKDRIIAEYEKSINKIKTPSGKKVVDEKDTLAEKRRQILSKNFECDLDVCPRPRNGLQDILDKLIIPEQVKRLNISGIVTVDADVDEYGLVRDTKIISGLGYGADYSVEVALYVTEFIPAKVDGKDVRTTVRINVPINIK